METNGMVILLGGENGSRLDRPPVHSARSGSLAIAWRAAGIAIVFMVAETRKRKPRRCARDVPEAALPCLGFAALRSFRFLRALFEIRFGGIADFCGLRLRKRELVHFRKAGKLCRIRQHENSVDRHSNAEWMDFGSVHHRDGQSILNQRRAEAAAAAVNTTSPDCTQRVFSTFDGPVSSALSAWLIALRSDTASSAARL
jgi:hypothetical protein